MISSHLDDRSGGAGFGIVAESLGLKFLRMMFLTAR